MRKCEAMRYAIAIDVGVKNMGLIPSAKLEALKIEYRFKLTERTAWLKTLEKDHQNGEEDDVGLIMMMRVEVNLLTQFLKDLEN